MNGFMDYLNLTLNSIKKILNPVSTTIWGIVDGIRSVKYFLRGEKLEAIAFAAATLVCATEIVISIVKARRNTKIARKALEETL